MTLYSNDNNSLRELIPLYVKGLLSDSQRKEFERSLTDKPELKEEIERWRKIGDAYKKIECELPRPSNMAYSRVLEKTKTTERKIFFERFMPSRSLSFALIAVEFLVIIFLVVHVASFRTEYRTLSAPSTAIKRPVRINIVFKEGASEAAIRDLLLAIDGKIVDGPFESGLYVIGIASEKELERSMNLIRNSGIAAMAERAY